MSAVFSVLILGALSLAISRRFLREPVGVFSAYRDVGIRQFLVLLAALILLGVVAVVYVTAAILLGVALALNNGGLAIAYGIVAGVGSLILLIFVAVRLVFVAPVVVIERTGVFRAVRRSWWLARGYWWRIVGLTTLVTILVGIIGGILGGFAAVLSLNHPVIATGLSGVLSVLTQPVQYCAITLLYYDQRIRKEGFDLEYAAHESARIAGQWSPPAFS